MRRFANTSYGCKVLFDKFLSKELESCALKIDAFYESAACNQIMSTHISNDQTVHVGINISFKEEPMFFGCYEPNILTIAFRSYFIINYLHCLQAAKETVPYSFFSGLVALDSINDLFSNKRKIVCIPNAFGSNKHLRPIDVHCAIRAMTKLLMDNSLSIVDEALTSCEAYKDILVAYTGVPEIVYLKSKHAQYTVLSEMAAFRSLVLQNSNITRECALFQQVGMKSFNSLNIGTLLSACDVKDNSFWPGMILRMFALAPNGKALNKYMDYSCMKTAYYEFYSNSLECYILEKRRSKLLKDNLQAAKHLARGIEQSTDYNASAIDGMLHYIK